MPGYLLTSGSSVSCAHQGTATSAGTAARVKLGGQPAIFLTPPYTVGGCPLPPPPSGNGPCVTGTFTAGTTRVTSNKQPLAIQQTPGQCVPTGVPLLVTQTQTRVRAT